MRARTYLMLTVGLLLVLSLACGLPGGGAGPVAPSFTASDTPTTLAPVCTPPLCRADEVYHCPGDCPGGCGTICVTPTPSPTFTPTAELEPWQQPVLSVVYSQEGALWWAVGYNAPRPLTSGSEDFAPQFSPDGQWVLFRREAPPGPSGLGRFELWVVRAWEESVARRLVAADDLPGVMGAPMDGDGPVLLDRLPGRTAWLPDGQRVAFTTFIEGGYGLDTRLDLWVVDVETGALTRLLPDGEGGAFAFSPDGTALLVASPEAVALLDADGRNRRELLRFPAVNTASEYAYIPQPLWMPDSSAGLIAITSPEPWEDGASCSLWRVSRAGSAVQIGTLPTACLFNTMDDALWSPDRAWLAYATEYGGNLLLANADGSAARVYAEGAGHFLGWSRDGRRFVFAQWYAERMLLGGPELEPTPFVDPEEVGQIIALKWADASTYAFVAVDTAYTRTLWVGELGGEPRIIDTHVDDFDVFR